MHLAPLEADQGDEHFRAPPLPRRGLRRLHHPVLSVRPNRFLSLQFGSSDELWDAAATPGSRRTGLEVLPTGGARGLFRGSTLRSEGKLLKFSYAWVLTAEFKVGKCYTNWEIIHKKPLLIFHYLSYNILLKLICILNISVHTLKLFKWNSSFDNFTPLSAKNKAEYFVFEHVRVWFVLKFCDGNFLAQKLCPLWLEYETSFSKRFFLNPKLTYFSKRQIDGIFTWFCHLPIFCRHNLCFFFFCSLFCVFLL